MKLLISIKDVDEAEDAVLGGADIIDIKDPTIGSLGLPDLDILNPLLKSRGSFPI